MTGSRLYPSAAFREKKKKNRNIIPRFTPSGMRRDMMVPEGMVMIPTGYEQFSKNEMKEMLAITLKEEVAEVLEEESEKREEHTNHLANAIFGDPVKIAKAMADEIDARIIVEFLEESRLIEKGREILLAELLAELIAGRCKKVDNIGDSPVSKDVGTTVIDAGAYYVPYIPDLPNFPKFSDDVLEEQTTKPNTEQVWITGDGTRIPISEMTEEHAKNALGMIMQLASRGHYWKMNDEGKLVWKHSEQGKLFTSEFPCDIITPWIQPLQESVKEDLTENTSSINLLSSKLMRPTLESPSVQAVLLKSPLRKDGTVMFTERSSKIVSGIYALQSSLTDPKHLYEK